MQLCTSSVCLEPHDLTPGPMDPVDDPFWSCARLAAFWYWSDCALRTTPVDLRKAITAELRLFFLKQLAYDDLSGVAKRLIHEF